MSDSCALSIDWRTPILLSSSTVKSTKRFQSGWPTRPCAKVMMSFGERVVRSMTVALASAGVDMPRLYGRTGACEQSREYRAPEPPVLISNNRADLAVGPELQL